MSEKAIENLKLEVKVLILDSLKIQDVDPNDILDDVPLFGGQNILTIDSIDALEITMAIQRKFNVRLDDQNLARSIITSVNSIAEFIYAQQPVE